MNTATKLIAPDAINSADDKFCRESELIAPDGAMAGAVPAATGADTLATESQSNAAIQTAQDFISVPTGVGSKDSGGTDVRKNFGSRKRNMNLPKM